MFAVLEILLELDKLILLSSLVILPLESFKFWNTLFISSLLSQRIVLNIKLVSCKKLIKKPVLIPTKRDKYIIKNVNKQILLDNDIVLFKSNFNSNLKNFL